MRLILALVFLLLVFRCYAQDTAITKWSLTCKPLGAIDPLLANYTLGIEYKINQHFLAELNGGIIKTYLGSSTENAENIHSTGFKVSAEIKYLIVKGLYAGIQAFYNDYDKTSDEYVWRFAQTYQQRFRLHRLITAGGGHLKAGYIFKRPSRKFFYDFYTGMGVRQTSVTIRDLPDDSELINAGDADLITNPPGKRVFPSIALGATIGYKL